MRRLIQRIRPRRAEPLQDVAVTETKPSVPAGAEPADAVPPGVSFHERGRARRRLRHLRRLRELAFRDLGGLVYDQHRFEKHDEKLVKGKVEALSAIDRELRALEVALDDRRPLHELREPGIAECPRCGALHGSDANWCPQCGLELRGKAPASPPPPAASDERPTATVPAAEQ